MSIEPFAQCADECNQRERKNGGGQDHMRDQNDEVDEANWSLAAEWPGTSMHVVCHVGHEKECGRNAGGDHERAMLLHSATTNFTITKEQQDRCEGIQGRVDCREVSNGQ